MMSGGAGADNDRITVRLNISTLAERPDLASPCGTWNSWPEFMRHDPIGGLYYNNCTTRFADYVLVALDDDGEVVAQAHSIPFVAGRGRPCRARLGLRHPQRRARRVRAARPERGLRGRDRRPAGPAGQRPVGTDARRDAGQRRSPRLRRAGRAGAAQRQGRRRTSRWRRYAFRTRDDGLPVDPGCACTSARAASIDSVAPRSMCIPRHARGVAASGPVCRSTRPVPSRSPQALARSGATSSTASRRTSSRTSGCGTAPAHVRSRRGQRVA